MEGKSMKKILVGIVLLLGLLVLFVGCTEGDAEKPKADYEVFEWGVIAGHSESDQMSAKQSVIFVHAGSVNAFSIIASDQNNSITQTYPETEPEQREFAEEEGTILWNNVKIITGGVPDTKTATDATSLKEAIPILNSVDTNLLDLNGTKARFIFYEEEIFFENKVTADFLDVSFEKELTVKNNADYAVYDLVVVTSDGSQPNGGDMLIGLVAELNPGEEKKFLLEKNNDFDDVKEKTDLTAKMLNLGFTDSEAEAFAKLWEKPFIRPSKTTEFSRLHYRILPEKTNEQSPLKFNPTPKKVQRVIWVLVDLQSKITQIKCRPKFDEIERELIIANHCNTVSDCKYSGLARPWDEHAVNISADLGKVKEMILKYKAECDQDISEKQVFSGLQCFEGKCVEAFEMTQCNEDTNCAIVDCERLLPCQGARTFCHENYCACECG